MVDTADRVSALTFSVKSITVPDAMRTCFAKRKLFTGTLTFDVRDHVTNDVLLSKQLKDFEIDLWAFGWYQEQRQFATVGKEPTVGSYIDNENNVSYMKAYQILDFDGTAKHIAQYFVAGVRCPSVDPNEVQVVPFHDPDVVQFLCKELYRLTHGRVETPSVPIILDYKPSLKRARE